MCIVSLDKALSLHRLVYPGEIELLHVKLCWQLICNRLGSHVGGVNDSHPLLTKGYKAAPLSLILFFKFCSMINFGIWYGTVVGHLSARTIQIINSNKIIGKLIKFLLRLCSMKPTSVFTLTY